MLGRFFGSLGTEAFGWPMARATARTPDPGRGSSARLGPSPGRGTSTRLGPDPIRGDSRGIGPDPRRGTSERL